MLTKRTVLRAFAAAGMLLVAALPAAAEKIVVTDIIGRKVEVEAPVRKVILGEGRQMYFVAALDKDEPFKRVVA